MLQCGHKDWDTLKEVVNVSNYVIEVEWTID